MKPIEVKWDAAKGVWFARPYLGRDAVSKRAIRPYRQFPEAGSRAEAQQMAEEWASGLGAAEAMHVQTRLDALLERYVQASEISGQITASTAKTYLSLICCYVAPYIGHRDPKGRRAHEIQELYEGLLISGAKVRGRGISPAKVAQLHWFLSGAWRWMVKFGFADSNPIDAVETPRSPQVEASALSERDASTMRMSLLEALAGGGADDLPYGYALAALIALESGARCGEACALMEADVWWRTGNLHIGGTVIEPGGPPKPQPYPKGKRSRNVAMGRVLRLAVQASIDRSRGEEGLRKRKPSMLPVCCGPGGTILRPSKVSDAFTAYAKRLGMPKGTTFHTLRHTHASVLLANGLDYRAVQERLGHSTPDMTMRKYAHLMPGRDDAAAEIMDSLEAGAGEPDGEGAEAEGDARARGDPWG